MRRCLGAFLAIFIVLSSASLATSAKDVHYLARISSLTALYDENLEKIEFFFETTGTLYHEQSFSVSLTCTAYEGGRWKEDKLLLATVYTFDNCVKRENCVTGELDLAKDVYKSPLYKDFALTVDGISVNMGDMIEGEYYSLDSKSVALSKKDSVFAERLTLATEISSKRVALGNEFTYKVYPVGISRNLSGGLSRFTFTLNYDPAVMRLEGVTCSAPKGKGWEINEYGFVSTGYKISLVGMGVKDDGDVSVSFRFVSLATTDTTELYVMNVGGGDSYGNSFAEYEWELCDARPLIKETAKGDLNADECVDSLDASVALKYDAGILSFVSLSGDVNGDGYVDSLDASMVLKYDAGIIDSIG